MDWEDLFEPQILDRGWMLFQSKEVKKFEFEGETLKAEVQGTKLYQVEIDFDFDFEDSWLDWLYCECPYAEGDRKCKHMAAVLYEMADRGLLPDDPEDDELAEEVDIIELVNQTNETDLRAFLLETFKDNSELARDFILKYHQGSVQINANDYLLKVTELVDEYQDYSGFIDYEDAFDFTDELGRLVSKDGRTLVHHGEYQIAFELSRKVYNTINNIEMDDSGGGLTQVSYELLTLWEQLVKEAPGDILEKMYAWVNGSLARGGDIFAERLEEFQQLFEKKNASYLKRNLEFARSQLTKVSQRPEFERAYYKLKWTMEKLRLLIALKHPRKEIENTFRNNWQNSEIRKAYVDWCLGLGEVTKAIEVLQESIEMDAENKNLVNGYQRQLKDIYHDEQDFENYEMMLKLLLRKGDYDTLTYFKEMKAYYPQNQWVNVKEQVYRELANSKYIYRLYGYEKDYPQLMAYIKKYNSLSVAESYYLELKDRYPREYRHVYESNIRALTDTAGSRKDYQLVAQKLRTLKGIPGGRLSCDTLIKELIAKYPRRRAMKDEFSKIAKGI